MSAEFFDALTESTAKSVTRRQTLRGLAAVLGGVLLTGVGGRTALADPTECVTCTCGVGHPCNPKSTACTTTQGFPTVGQACTSACAKKNQQFCGGAQEFHCPHGCPS
jgi:hypothetical protein